MAASSSRFSVNTFLGNFGRPARGVKFQCQITLPDISSLLAANIPILTDEVLNELKSANVFAPFGSQQSPITYACFAANLPEIAVELSELNYFTRPVRYPGRRTLAPLTLSFYNTEDYALRRAFEQWNFLLSSPVDNLGFVRYSERGAGVPTVATLGQSRAVELAGEMRLTHYSETDQPISAYEFRDVFPVSISPLAFNYNNDGEIQTFDVTLAYNVMFQRQP